MQDWDHRCSRLIALAVLATPPLAADGTLPWASPLHSIQWFDQQPSLPPLDSALLFARKTDGDTCHNCTREILSLIYEQPATDATLHSWPFYIQLDTRSNAGSATGANARIYSRGAGWTAAHHGEAIAYAPGSTNIAFNAELSPMTSGSRLVGINLVAKNGYGDAHPGQWSDEAVNIQSDAGAGWATGIKFEHVRTGTGIDFGPESSGGSAIRIRGNYAVGLDMGDTDIRLNTGARVCFDGGDRVCMRYNPRKNRLEIMNGGNVLGYFNANKAKAAGRCLNC
jgi:hypothetical protein